MNIALIRSSSIALHSYSTEHQIKSIRNAAGESMQLVQCTKRRLIRQSISVRLENLGLLEIVQSRKCTIWISDLSRMFSSLKEIKRGIRFLTQFNTVLKSVKEDLDTSRDNCRVIEQLEYFGEFLNTHALEKLASSIDKVKYNRQGRPPNSCLVALNIINTLREGQNVTTAAKLNNTTRDYIWRHCLTHPSVQLFYLGLTPEHIASNSESVYEEARKLVLKIKTEVE